VRISYKYKSASRNGSGWMEALFFENYNVGKPIVFQKSLCLWVKAGVEIDNDEEEEEWFDAEE
jgi:hypothetical protein